MRPAHAQKVERWLGSEQAVRLALASEDIPVPIPISGTPWAAYRGDIVRKPVLAQIVSTGRRYLADELGGFASLADLVATGRNGGLGIQYAIKSNVAASSAYLNLFPRATFPNGSWPTTSSHQIQDGGRANDYTRSGAIILRPPAALESGATNLLAAIAVSSNTTVPTLLLVDYVWDAAFPLGASWQTVPGGSRNQKRRYSKNYFISAWWDATPSGWSDFTVTPWIGWGSQGTPYTWSSLNSIGSPAAIYSAGASESVGRCWYDEQGDCLLGLYEASTQSTPSAANIIVSLQEAICFIPVVFQTPSYQSAGVPLIKGGFNLPSILKEGCYTIFEVFSRNNSITLYVRFAVGG